MRLDEVRIEPFSLPYAYGQRQGLYVHLTSSCGRKALSEASPLPGFSKESLEQVHEELCQLSPKLKGFDVAQKLPPLLPATTWALYSAILELTHPIQAPTITSAGYLDPTLPFCFEAFEAKSTLKVKLAPLNMREAVAFFTKHLEQLKAFKLRLDCNQRWPLSQVHALLKEVNGLSIDYIEEPLIDRSTSLYPLAADESLRGQGLRFDASVWVIKPMLSPELIDAWQRQGKGTRLVISSSYETKVGLEHLEKLCARIGVQDTCMGLDTLKLFTMEV